MEKLTPQDLYSLEKYAELRADFRAKVMAHKKNRQIQIGPHARLYFEDKLTVQYQVQEMLRAERIFERAGIEAELHAYNPLIPDGSNWKATFMLEYDEVEARRAALAKLIGIEDRIWVKVQGHSPVFAIADEDLKRANETKTAAVHFLRFALNPAMVRVLKQGAEIEIGIDHPAYRYQVSAVPAATRAALVQDLTAF